MELESQNKPLAAFFKVKIEPKSPISSVRVRAGAINPEEHWYGKIKTKELSRDTCEGS